MQRETMVILLLIAVVLLPMWYVALTSRTESGGVGVGTGAGPVAVSTSSDLQPANGYLPGPIEVGISQTGVVAWVALLGMVGVMVGTKRFLDRISHLGDFVIADGSHATVPVPPYMKAKSRRILDYVPAVSSRTGLLAVALLSRVDVSFAALLALEGLGPTQTQFLGTYAGMLFLSFALTVLAYAAYFVPSVAVVEIRDRWPPAWA